jgi:hypothetical protein
MNPEQIRGPLSFVSTVIGETREEYRRLPPQQKLFEHVGMAASTLGWWIYLAATLGPEFAPPLLHSARLSDAWPLAAAAGVLLIVVLWLLAAMKAAQGARNFGTALYRLLLTGLWSAALWWQIWPHGRDWQPLAGFFIAGLYWGWLGSSVARFLVAAQLFVGGNARGDVVSDIAAREFNWEDFK